MQKAKNWVVYEQKTHLLVSILDVVVATAWLKIYIFFESPRLNPVVHVCQWDHLDPNESFEI